MSLFRTTIRPSASITDTVIERYLESLRTDLGPDPAFRSRLRGRVVNGHVAAREGLGTRRAAAREMTRIGRAVLFASFVLGVSVTGAMAASQHAIPGDAFYALKLNIETLRYRVVPDHLHDEVAAHALAERMVELDRLVAADRLSDLAAQVAVVEAAYDRVIEFGAEAPGVEDRLSFVAAILERLPDEARAAVEQAFHGAKGGTDARGQERGTPRRPMDDPPGRGGTAPAVGSDGGSPGAQPTVRPTESVQPSPPATANPNSGATPKPKPSQAAEPAEPTRPPHPHHSPSASPESP